MSQELCEVHKDARSIICTELSVDQRCWCRHSGLKKNLSRGNFAILLSKIFIYERIWS